MSQEIYIGGGLLTEATGQSILTALGGAGLSKDQLIFHDYDAANVDTAYVTVGGTSVNATIKMDIFDSSGEPMILGVDTAGGTAYADTYYIAPGGNGFIEIGVPAGSTFGVKRQTVTGGAAASAGFLQITTLY